MNDEKIILALISSPTVADASKSLNITPQTIYNRLRDDSFRERYAESRRLMLECECYRLQSYVADAIETMHNVATDDTASDQIKVNASDAILRHCYRMTEICDILTRLEKVEKLVEANNE